MSTLHSYRVTAVAQVETPLLVVHDLEAQFPTPSAPGVQAWPSHILHTPRFGSTVDAWHERLTLVVPVVCPQLSAPDAAVVHAPLIALVLVPAALDTHTAGSALVSQVSPVAQSLVCEPQKMPAAMPAHTRSEVASVAIDRSHTPEMHSRFGPAPVALFGHGRPLPVFSQSFDTLS